MSFKDKNLVDLKPPVKINRQLRSNSQISNPTSDYSNLSNKKNLRRRSRSRSIGRTNHGKTKIFSLNISAPGDTIDYPKNNVNSKIENYSFFDKNLIEDSKKKFELVNGKAAIEYAVEGFESLNYSNIKVDDNIVNCGNQSRDSFPDNGALNTERKNGIGSVNGKVNNGHSINGFKDKKYINIEMDVNHMLNLKLKLSNGFVFLGSLINWFIKLVTDSLWMLLTILLIYFFVIYILLWPENLQNLTWSMEPEWTFFFDIFKFCYQIIYHDEMFFKEEFKFYLVVVLVIFISTAFIDGKPISFSKDRIVHMHKLNGVHVICFSVFMLYLFGSIFYLIPSANELISGGLKQQKLQIIKLCFSAIALATVLSLTFFIKNLFTASSQSYISRFVFGVSSSPTMLYKKLSFKMFLLNLCACVWISLLIFVTYLSIILQHSIVPILISAAIQATHILINWGYFQEYLLSSDFIMKDRIGLIFIFTTVVFLPFINTIPLFDMLSTNHDIKVYLIILSLPLFVFGMYLFFDTNRMKYKFKLSIMEMSKENQHFWLSDSWWGICRHPNHISSMLIYIAATLPYAYLGLAYCLPLVFNVLFLLIRTFIFERSCREKNTVYITYSKQVRTAIIPFIF